MSVSLFRLIRSVTGTSVNTEDLNLNQTLFGMWGVGQTQAPGRLTQHAVTPTTSVQPLNPAVDTNQNRIAETVSGWGVGVHYC